MRHSGWLAALAALSLVMGSGLRAAAQPAAGSVTAEIAFPPPGSRFVVRTTGQRGSTTTRTWVVLEDGVHEGRPVHRATVGATTVLFDRATRNYVATLRDGKVIERFTPHRGSFAWPLAVGKVWDAHMDQEDVVRAMSWTGGHRRVTVEAYEDVTVPAGTFRAFRLHDVPVGGSTTHTVWYAPEIAWVVKSVDEASAGYYRGPGKSTSELIEYHRAGAVATGPRPSTARPAPPSAPAAPPATAATPPAASPPAAAAARGEFTYKVTYRVKGTAGSVMLTYRNRQGGTEQASVRLPWEVSFDARGGSFLYVSAQNQGVSGSVTCEILLDDETRTNSTSTGAYVVAECSNAAER